MSKKTMRGQKTKRRIRIIGAPLDLGAGHRGVDMGPSAFRVAGIHQAVRDLGIPVEDSGDIEAHVAETRDPGNPRLKYLKEIRATCVTLRNVVRRTMDEGVTPGGPGRRPLDRHGHDRGGVPAFPEEEG